MWPFNEKVKTEESILSYNYNPTISEKASISLVEQFKSQVEQKVIRFPKELGEEHPFNFKEMELLYKKFGFFTAVVDKYIDFVVGPGFFVECEDERAKQIIDDFMRDVNFDTILRAWCKEGLVKGNGFLELGGNKKEGVKGIKCLNANYIYVVRDNKGNVLEYNQYVGDFDKFVKDKVIPLGKENVAHFAFNVVGDCAYGIGLGYSSLRDVDNILRNECDSHQILNRKANSPLHAQLGKVDGDTKIIPKPEDVAAFGQKMENMTNKTEWSTDALVNFKVIDFGAIGDKFTSILDYDINKLIYDYQIPGVLLGMANVPEGLANAQMDTFQRKINSIQAELEKVIEQKIFRRILQANGLDVHVEFQWGEPSDDDKMKRLTTIKDLMNNVRLSDSLFKLLEEDVVKLLGYDENAYSSEINKEEQIRNELERIQPIVPGQNKNIPPEPTPAKEKLPQPKPEEMSRLVTTLKEIVADTNKPKTIKLKKEVLLNKRKNKNYEYEKSCPHCTESYDNYNDIEEWLGFNYKKYLSNVLLALSAYDFDDIRAITESERIAGYLTDDQISKLKEILDNGFRKGSTMTEIARQIDNKVGLKDLYRMTEDGNIKKGASGLPILSRSADKRGMLIARTEVTRVANKGAIDYFKENNISKVKWVASYGDRTCPECEDLNNQIFSINEVPSLPLHALCRCTTMPITEVK